MIERALNLSWPTTEGRLKFAIYLVGNVIVRFSTNRLGFIQLFALLFFLSPSGFSASLSSFTTSIFVTVISGSFTFRFLGLSFLPISSSRFVVPFSFTFSISSILLLPDYKLISSVFSSSSSLSFSFGSAQFHPCASLHFFFTFLDFFQFVILITRFQINLFCLFI